MPQRFTEPTLALLLALAVIGGAWGAGAVAAWQVLRGKRVGWAFVVAYLLVGAFIGGLTYLLGAGALFMGEPDRVLVWSMLAGVAGTLALVAKDFGARFILRRAGWEMRTEIYPIPRREGDEHDPRDDSEYRGG